MNFPVAPKPCVFPMGLQSSKGPETVLTLLESWQMAYHSLGVSEWLVD